MKETDKNQLIQNLQVKVNTHLQQSSVLFKELNASQLNKRSLTGGWSIAQCLDHLNSYGDHYLPKIADAIKAALADQNSLFVSSWLGKYFTGMMDPDKSSRKYKAARIHQPAVNPDPAAVVSEFIAQQEELIAMLHQCRSINLNAVKIPISINRFIKLNLGDVLIFMITHNERHMRQALQNLSHQSFSPVTQ